MTAADANWVPTDANAKLCNETTSPGPARLDASSIICLLAHGTTSLLSLAIAERSCLRQHLRSVDQSAGVWNLRAAHVSGA